MIDERILIFAVCLILVSAVTFGLHDRHYRRRRDVVREARIRALEAQAPHPEKIMEARVDALESILLEDETT